MSRADSLPNDVESLKQLLNASRDQVQSLSVQLQSRNVLIEQLKLQLAKLKRMKFGRSSEQLDALIAQLELSLEELEANAAATPSTAEMTVRAATKPARQALLSSCRAKRAFTSRRPVRASARSAAARYAPSAKMSLKSSTSRSIGRCIGMCVRSTGAPAARASCKRAHRRDRSSAAMPARDYWPTS